MVLKEACTQQPKNQRSDLSCLRPQSAMGDDGGSSPYKNSFTLTAAKLDLTDPLNAKLAGVYLYVGELPAQRSIP